jgi:hypothetical protein
VVRIIMVQARTTLVRANSHTLRARLGLTPLAAARRCSSSQILCSLSALNLAWSRSGME